MELFRIKRKDTTYIVDAASAGAVLIVIVGMIFVLAFAMKAIAKVMGIS